MDKIIIETPRLFLQNLQLDHVEAFCILINENKSFFQAWAPLVDDEFFTIAFQKKLFEKKLQDQSEKKEIRFFIFEKENQKKIIGEISFTNIIMGVLQSCFLGVKMHEKFTNKNYATEALRSAIDFVFDNFQLHRIEANIMPENYASIKVIEKLNFQKEGYSPKYLKINGEWKDHLRYAILNPNT